MKYWLWGGIAALFFLSPLHVLLGWLVVPAIALYVAALLKTERIRTAIGGSVLVGTAKAAGAILWVWHVYPLVWLDLPPGMFQVVCIGIFWLGVALSIGVAMGVCGAAMVYAIRHDARWRFAFPFILLLSEIVGSITFALYSLGPGSYGLAHFGFGYVGVALAYIPFVASIAVFGGVYILSLAAGLLGLFAHEIGKDRRILRTRLAGITFITLGMILVAAHLIVSGRDAYQPSGAEIAVVTHFNTELFLEPEGYDLQHREVAGAVHAALAYEPSLVLLPEDARFTTGFASTKDALADLRAQSTTARVIDSSRITDERGETVLRAFLYDLPVDIVYVVDKQYLVPQGEYVPYLITHLLRVLGASELRDSVERNQSYVPGVLTSYAEVPAHLPSVLFCFESAVPYAAQLRVREDQDLVVHPVSHGWFHDPVLLQTQLRTMLRIQAIWNGVAILQTGNLAESARFEPNGSITYGSVLESSEYWTLYGYNGD